MSQPTTRKIRRDLESAVCDDRLRLERPAGRRGSGPPSPRHCAARSVPTRTNIGRLASRAEMRTLTHDASLQVREASATLLQRRPPPEGSPREKADLSRLARTRPYLRSCPAARVGSQERRFLGSVPTAYPARGADFHSVCPPERRSRRRTSQRNLLPAKTKRGNRRAPPTNRMNKPFFRRHRGFLPRTLESRWDQPIRGRSIVKERD